MAVTSARAVVKYDINGIKCWQAGTPMQPEMHCDTAWL